MAIIIEIVNPKNNLSKKIDVTNYTKQEKIKTYSVYTKAGFGVYLAEGIEEIIKGARV